MIDLAPARGAPSRGKQFHERVWREFAEAEGENEDPMWVIRLER